MVVMADVHVACCPFVAVVSAASVSCWLWFRVWSELQPADTCTVLLVLKLCTWSGTDMNKFHLEAFAITDACRWLAVLHATLQMQCYQELVLWHKMLLPSERSG